MNIKQYRRRIVYGKLRSGALLVIAGAIKTLQALIVIGIAWMLLIGIWAVLG